jgi:hypothetical protein
MYQPVRPFYQSVVCAFFFCFFAPPQSRADFMGTDKDGPLYATVDASLSANTITLTLTDLSGLNSSNQWTIGQAIADVGFQITGLTGTASITGVTGTLVDNNGNTSALTLSNLTWGIASNPSSSPSVIALGTIGWTYDGLPVGGAPPNELIGNGAYESQWNSSMWTGSHLPDILTSVTFTISAPGVTSSSTFSNEMVAFGTQPEAVISGKFTTPTTAVPAPSSVSLLGIGLVVFLARWYLARSQRRTRVAASV